MKKIKLIILGLMTLGIISACKKNSLDRTPEANISEVDFWKTASDVRLYANGFYNTTLLPIYTGFGTVGIYGLDADQGSDNMVRFEYNRNVLNGERILPATDASWDWTQIRNVNYFIQNYSKTTVAFDAIKSYVGEAYFFRALAYFTLLKSYGDLPWVNKLIDQNDREGLTQPRLRRNIIVDSMLNDLDRAISYLPATKATDLRVTGPVAQALKARVALYEGTWEKYHAGTPFGVNGSNGSKYLEIAAETAQSFISSGLYGLDNVTENFGYWKLFNQSDYTTSNEVIFWRKFDPTQNVSNYWSAYMRVGNNRGITKNLVDDYLCTDGKPKAVSPLYQGDDSLKLVVENRDLRLAQTIAVNDENHPLTLNNPDADDLFFKYPAFSGAQEDKCPTGYQLYKGLQTDFSKQVINRGDNGVIYFRYAEILLILAEAKAELGTLTQADVDLTINKLRDRAGVAHLNISNIDTDPNWLFPSLSPIINEVRRERRVELAVEGYRHDDIWRWAAADELIFGWKAKGAKLEQWQGVVPASDLAIFKADGQGYIDVYAGFAEMSSGYKFKLNRDYLLPIPIDQLTLNPNLGQNPGW